MTDGPFDSPTDDAWWEAVLADPRARRRPEDLEDGLIDDDFGDWEPNRQGNEGSET